MRAPRFRVGLLVLVPVLSTLLSYAVAARVSQDPAEQPACAHTWIGHEAAIEDYLKTAAVVSMKEVPVGVTRPSRAELAPGGPVASMAWKPLTPGIRSGFWESYKSEIAAYEMDKLLGLGMKPPTVEKRVKGDLGAAVMWASPTQSFKEKGGVPSAPPQHFHAWNRQLIRAKMFDNLIANKDPNLGNWLVDPDWHLILIDHSRSFTTMKTLVHKMDRIDAELWERIKALDADSLTAALGRWLGRSEIRAILERRAEMEKAINSMVAAKGEAAVFVR